MTAALSSPVDTDDRGAAVARAVRYMGERLTAPRPLAELARVGLFSTYHFHRLFCEVTSVTPARFLAALRMAQARRQLLHTALPVREISQRVGYGSLGTFTTQFTRLVGVSPGAFRELARSLHGLAIGALLDAVARRRPSPRGPTLIVDAGTGPGGLLVVGLCPLGDTVEHSEPTLSAVATPNRVAVPAPDRLGAGPVPPGDGYRVWALLADARCTVTEVLVDQAPGTHLVGAARLRPPTGPVPQIGLRPPAPTDPPLLSAAPLRYLAHLAG